MKNWSENPVVMLPIVLVNWFGGPLVVFFVSMHYGAPWWAAALLGITVGSLVGSVLFVLGAIVVGMIAVSRESR
jgi:hypothetical protein